MYLILSTYYNNDKWKNYFIYNALTLGKKMIFISLMLFPLGNCKMFTYLQFFKIEFEDTINLFFL